MTGGAGDTAAALAEAVRPASGLGEAGGAFDRVLPVLPGLERLLPGRGLRRGSAIAVSAARQGRERRPWRSLGSTSLLLALLAEASGAGAWCAVVGLPALGALAAAELGIALDRLLLVPYPGPEWPTVVAALADGVDAVVVAPPAPVPVALAGRLTARARQRGTVLIPHGDWPGADVTLDVSAVHWSGLGAGRGRLRHRDLTITAHGRGSAAHPRQTVLSLPAPTLPLAARPPLTLLNGGRDGHPAAADPTTAHHLTLVEAHP